jgi:hypothetical protein
MSSNILMQSANYLHIRKVTTNRFLTFLVYLPRVVTYFMYLTCGVVQKDTGSGAQKLLRVERGCTISQLKQLFANLCSPSVSVHLDTCAGKAICISQQPTLSPAPFFQTALARQPAKELQELHSAIITYAHTGGLLTHLQDQSCRCIP